MIIRYAIAFVLAAALAGCAADASRMTGVVAIPTQPPPVIKSD